MRYLGVGLVTATMAMAACGGAEPYQLELRGDVPRPGSPRPWLVVRDGDDAWRPVALGTDGIARVEIRGGYHAVAWSCANAVRVMYDAAGGEPVDVCVTDDFGVTVSGTAGPDTAAVLIGPTFALALGATWSAQVWPGTYDVLAVTDNAFEREMVQIEILRDVQIDQPRTLELDPATRGISLVQVEAPMATAGSTFTTRRGTSVGMSALPEGVWIVPASARAEGDRVAISTTDGTIGVQREVIGDTLPALVARPDLPTAVASQAGVRVDGAWDRVAWALEQPGPSTGARWVRLAATAAWSQAADTDRVQLPAFAQLPGWDATTLWRPGELLNATVTVELGDRAGDLDARTTISTITW